MIIPNLDFGGAQRSFCNLANKLNEEHSVYVCVFNNADARSFPLNPQLIDLKVPAGKHLFSKGYFFIKRLFAISQLKKKLNIDTTISYLEGANYLNALTGNDRKLLSVRGSKYYDHNIAGLLGWIRKEFLVPLIYTKATYIVVLNNGIKKELTLRAGIDEKKIRVIRNFYHVQRLRKLAGESLSSTYEFLEKQSFIIYAGRLATGKGLFSILDCYQELKKGHHGLKLVLVGDGPLKQQIVDYANSTDSLVYIEGVSQISEIEISDILFLGYQENPYQYISRAKFLFIASSSEGGPNILMEALICGTMVISTDCPYGPSEQLAPELHGIPVKQVTVARYGILLPLLDNKQQQINQWSREISNYLNNETLRNEISGRVREWVHTQSPILILDRWKQII